MKADRKRRRNNFAALRLRLFLRIVILSVCAVIAVFVCRKISLGRTADFIIKAFSRVFHIDDGAALNIYQFGIRNNLEALSAAAVIAFIVLGFWLLLGRFEKYLDEITGGIDALASHPDTELKLSPGLEFAENSLLKLQQALERRDEQARQAEQRKNDLIIYSAHEIRTPLTSSLGYLTLLDASPELPAAERRKYTGIALAKTRELDGMIDELFEIMRYNMHDIALEKTRFDLYGLLLQMKEEHYPLLRSCGKQISVTADEGVTLYADAEKLARAFNNLLKNAIAYGDPGCTIGVSAHLTGDTVTLQFKNRCGHIPQEKLDHLFDQFYRLDTARAANTGGAGLGLTIAKEIITLHEGTITAESTEEGINFVVCLPSQTAPI